MKNLDFFTDMLIFGRDMIYELSPPKLTTLDNNDLEMKLSKVKSTPCLRKKSIISPSLRSCRSSSYLHLTPSGKNKQKYLPPIDINIRQGWNNSFKIIPT